MPDHVRRRDRALPGLRRGHLIPHDYLAPPRRPRCPRARLQPAGADRCVVLFFAGAASTLAFFPREAASAAAPAPPRRRPSDAGPAHRSSSGSWRRQPRVPLVVPADGAKVLIVKFNDYQCPACGQSYLQYKPILAEVRSRDPGAVRLVHEGLPAEPRLQRRAQHDDAPGGLRRGGGRAAGAGSTTRRGDGGVAVRPSAGDDAADRCARRRATSARSPTSTRSTPSTLEPVKADVALGQQLGVKSTPTFFINGVKIEGGLRAAVLRSGDRVSSCRRAAPK